MLRIGAIGSAAELRVTLQHEFGHVITLMGAAKSRASNRWLSEGVAEYIGWWPKPATKSGRHASARWQLNRKRGTSMIPANPGKRRPSGLATPTTA